jgi:hypothetical protein
MPYENTLAAAVDTFVKLYDATRTAQLKANDTDQSERAIEALRLVIRIWAAAVSRDVPGFAIASFTDRLAAPDDVIHAGQRLLELCRAYKDGNGNPLSYQAELEKVLSEPMATAEKEWAAVRERLTTTQEMRKATRVAAVAVHKELVAFRRALRTEFGDSNIDYRSLRAQNVEKHDDTEEVVEDDPSAVDPYAPTVETKVPTGNGLASNDAGGTVNPSNGASNGASLSTPA